MPKKAPHKYNKNTLLRMQIVVDIYLKHKDESNTTVGVFRKYIEPYYPMSIGTLYNYLSTPIDRELKAIESKSEQLELFK
ncbi:MAG: hypothetical protein FD170_3946 [Bacteroidetes bacterium]|nr:MAG: hypothetical protein FD170_3946 [Bacteroidota bacterium]